MALPIEVQVQLITSKETGQAVVIKAFSNKPHPTGGRYVLQRTTNYDHMRSYSGGVERAVMNIGCMLGDELCDRFGDTEDPDNVAKAAWEAFKDAMARGEKQGFGKKIMEVGEDVYVQADVAQGQGNT